MKVLETVHHFRGYWSAGGVCRIVEHYPPAEAHGRRGRAETWDLVTFAHYRREQTMQHSPRGGWRYTLGEANWRHLGWEGFEVLLTPYVA